MEAQNQSWKPQDPCYLDLNLLSLEEWSVGGNSGVTTQLKNKSR